MRGRVAAVDHGLALYSSSKFAYLKMRKFPQTKFPIRFTQKCDMKFWFPTMAYFLCGKLNPVPPASARNHTPEGNGILDFLGSVHSGGRDICKIVTNKPWLWGLARAEARDSSCFATTSHLCLASLPRSDFWGGWERKWGRAGLGGVSPEFSAMFSPAYK